VAHPSIVEWSAVDLGCRRRVCTGPKGCYRAAFLSNSVASSFETRLRSGTMWSADSRVTRAAGPDMEMAVGVGALGTGTEKQRTPISCSPSSIAYPRCLLSSRSAISYSGSGSEFSVYVGMPVWLTSERTASLESWTRSALPTPVQWRYTRRPTSVNMRIECSDGTCAT
jgi:hypothetical protein